MIRRASVFSCALLLLAAALRIAHAQSTAPSVEDRVRAAVRDMQSERYADRQRGSQEMLGLPAEALPFLEKIAADPSTDPELLSRVRSNIERIRAKARAVASETRAAAISAWQIPAALAGYRAGGDHDPRWDADVQAAFDRLAPLNTGSMTTHFILCPPDVFQAFKKAIAAGCRDPLVVACYIRAGQLTRLLPDADDRTIIEAIYPNILDAKYPPAIKIFAILQYLDLLHYTDPQSDLWSASERRSILMAAAKLWPAAVADKTVPNAALELFARRLSEQSQKFAYTGINFFNRLYAPWLKARPNTAAPLAYKTYAYILYAWEGRGDGWASQVTPQGWKLFAERLATAREAATQAYALDVTDPWAPSAMIVACMGEDADETEMDTWFKRAVEADPENLQPYENKLYYLLPRWHGSHEEMLAFARAVVAEGHWNSRVPLILLAAHEAIAQESDDPNDYWKADGVWNDLQPLFTKLIDAHKSDHYLTYCRSLYAQCACYAERWSIASAQFQLLGTHFDFSVFGNAENYNHLRQSAAAHAAEK